MKAIALRHDTTIVAKVVMSQISAKEGFGGAIVGFCQDGRYTEDVDLAAKVDTDDLKQAHELVERQKSATQVWYYYNRKAQMLTCMVG